MQNAVKRQMHWIVALMASLVSVLVTDLGTWAQDGEAMSSLQALEKSFVDVIARSEPSIVAIARVRRERLRPQILSLLPAELEPDSADPKDPDFVPNDFGTGVVIDKAGLILTNYHVLGRDDDQVAASNYYVTTAERKVYEAKIKAADPWSDLAVLEIEARDLAPIPFGDASAVKKGHIVIVLGNPYSLARDGQVSAGWGIVSNLSRKLGPTANRRLTNGRETIHHHGTLIQTDAKLNLGTSGGAMVNLRGEMIGLTTSLAAAIGYESAAGFAVPMDDPMKRIVEALKSGIEVEYGFLGVAPENVAGQNRNRGQYGVLLRSVWRGTPAARAGLTAGDRVTHIDDRPIHDTDDLMLLIGSRPVESAVKLTIHRAEDIFTTRVELSKKRISSRRKAIVTSKASWWRGFRVDYSTASPEFDRLVHAAASDPGQCVGIVEVDQDGRAWDQGIRGGMFISHVDGNLVDSPQAFHAAVGNQSDAVELRFATYREGEEPTRTIYP